MTCDCLPFNHIDMTKKEIIEKAIDEWNCKRMTPSGEEAFIREKMEDIAEKASEAVIPKKIYDPETRLTSFWNACISESQSLRNKFLNN